MSQLFQHNCDWLMINEFDLKTGRTDRFIKTVKIDSLSTID